MTVVNGRVRLSAAIRDCDLRRQTLGRRGRGPDAGRVARLGGQLDDIHVRATRLARDILVQPDRIHPSATVDRRFVTLLAGESVTFRVRCPVALDAARVVIHGW